MHGSFARQTTCMGCIGDVQTGDRPLPALLRCRWSLQGLRNKTARCSEVFTHRR